jgi:hypothetical protein
MLLALLSVQAKCVGPARSSSEERLSLSWKQARSQFAKDYNDRLFTGLLLSAVGAIVLFRFVVKVKTFDYRHALHLSIPVHRAGATL